MILITLVALGLISCLYFVPIKNERTQIPKGGDMNKIVEGNNEFATDLYRLLATETEKNLFLGPNSIHTALGMTFLGARNETAKEMGKVLHLVLSPEHIGPAFGELIHALNSPQMVQEMENIGAEYKTKETPTYLLSVANALWVAKNFPFRKRYVAEVRKHFEARVKELDFMKEIHGADDYAKLFAVVKDSFSLIQTRAQMLLGLATICMTITGFSGPRMAASNPYSRFFIGFGLSFVLALCSTSDAFIAAPMAAFSSASKLAFLVFGPMLDVKLVFMYAAVFRRKFLIWLCVAMFALVAGLSKPWTLLIDQIQPKAATAEKVSTP